MPGITEHHLASLEQDRMAPGRPARETRVSGKLLENTAYRVQLAAIGNAVVSNAERRTSWRRRPAGGEPAPKGYKAGSEQSDANQSAQRDRPLRQKVGPKKRQDKEVSPNDNLDVVPFPWRQFHEIADKEDRQGRDKKRNGRRDLEV